MKTIANEVREYCKNPIPKNGLVVDYETSIVDGNPEPWAGAVVVMQGWHKFHTGETSVASMCGPIRFGKNSLVIGHNVGFDVRHNLAENPDAFGEFRMIDTAINEYLISGQTHKFPSLEDSCKRYGIPFEKDEVITSYFNEGAGADIIIANGHRDRLAEYLRKDVEVTKDLYIAQVTDPANQRLLPHFWVQGQAALIYSQMMLNGLSLDEDRLRKLRDVNTAQSAEITNLLSELCEMDLDYWDRDWKLTNRVFSTLLFNVPGIPYKTKVLDGKHKNGKPKFKTIERKAKLKASRAALHPRVIFGDNVKPNPNLGYSLDDKALAKIEEYLGPETDEPVGAVPKALVKKRAADKLVTTYCDPLLGKFNLDGVVHGSINSTVTRTGRTSSSGPNVQNMPPEVRRCFYGGEQFDVSQFELWAAAVLSWDEVLLDDVLNGDVHFETGKMTFGWTDPKTVPDLERRIAKGLNFGLIYLGSDKRLAAEAGCDITLAKAHRNSFSSRYHRFWNWAKDRARHVGGLKATFEKMDPQHGVPLHSRMEESLTGRRLVYSEKFVEWKGAASTSPSDCVNYPIQSFATADLFPLALIQVFLFEDFGLNPLVPVHDSALYENPKGIGEKWIASAAQYAIAQWPEIYNIPLDVGRWLDVYARVIRALPPSIDFKKGKHWT